MGTVELVKTFWLCGDLRDRKHSEGESGGWERRWAKIKQKVWAKIKTTWLLSF
jgi:hypothetical protein